MIAAVFRSAQKIAAGIKPKIVEKPHVTEIPETVKGEEEKTEKLVVCPFCKATLGKNNKRCPKC
ncbi:MAG: hypothetical protein QW279_05265 [Candidatus Jordarchaeaceae archaeon]